MPRSTANSRLSLHPTRPRSTREIPSPRTMGIEAPPPTPFTSTHTSPQKQRSRHSHAKSTQQDTEMAWSPSALPPHICTTLLIIQITSPLGSTRFRCASNLQNARPGADQSARRKGLGARLPCNEELELVSRCVLRVWQRHCVHDVSRWAWTPACVS